MQFTPPSPARFPDPSELPTGLPVPCRLLPELGRVGAEVFAATAPGDIGLAMESPPPGEVVLGEFSLPKLCLNFRESGEEL
jgi:hypothetical protein